MKLVKDELKIKEEGKNKMFDDKYSNTHDFLNYVDTYRDNTCFGGPSYIPYEYPSCSFMGYSRPFG